MDRPTFSEESFDSHPPNYNEGSLEQHKFQFKSIYHEPGEPHYVGINLQVHFVTNVDTVTQQFDVGFFLNYEWLPSKRDVINYNELLKKGKISEFVPEYLPDFRWPNMMSASQMELKHYLDGSLYTLLTDGEKDSRGAMTSLPNGLKYLIAARLAMRATFAEPFELENFPLDCQDLRITIVSTATCEQQKLIPHFRRNAFVTIEKEYTDLPAWNMHEPICDFSLSDKSKSARGYQFSSMTLLIKVSRKYWSHVMRTIFLILSLCLAQLFVFAVGTEPEDLADRLSISFTMVLTALVFMFVIESRLPTVSFLTLLDKYIYGTFVIMMIITLGSAAAVLQPEKEQRDQINMVMLIISVSLVTLLQVWFMYNVVMKRRTEEEKLKMNTRSVKQMVASPLTVKSDQKYLSDHSFFGSIGDKKKE